MTCVIGYVSKNKDCLYIGADSCVSYDSFFTTTKTPKVFYALNRKDILWGCCGSIRMANLISQDIDLFPENFNVNDEDILGYIINHVTPGLQEYSSLLKKEQSDFELLLGIDRQLFHIQGDLSVYQSKGIEAIGCGCESAYAYINALESYTNFCPEDKIRLSIEFASNFNYGVSLPVSILRTSTDKSRKMGDCHV